VHLTADQITLQLAALLAHGLGDYVFQSHWMATTKTSRSSAAAAHVVAYGLVFAVLVTRSALALAVIVGTHFVIDRWRLARHVVWAKNWLAPPGKGPAPWTECRATGYDPDVPPWLSTWLLIVVDNLMHVSINAVAVYLWAAT
jgi:hypothetical protein